MHKASQCNTPTPNQFCPGCHRDPFFVNLDRNSLSSNETLIHTGF